MTSPWQLCWPRLICNTYFCAQRLQAAAAVPFLINSTIIVRPSVRPSIGCGILSYERAFPKPQTETGDRRRGGGTGVHRPREGGGQKVGKYLCCRVLSRFLLPDVVNGEFISFGLAGRDSSKNRYPA